MSWAFLLVGPRNDPVGSIRGSRPMATPSGASPVYGRAVGDRGPGEISRGAVACAQHKRAMIAFNAPSEVRRTLAFPDAGETRRFGAAGAPTLGCRGGSCGRCG